MDIKKDITIENELGREKKRRETQSDVERD